MCYLVAKLILRALVVAVAAAAAVAAEAVAGRRAAVTGATDNQLLALTAPVVGVAAGAQRAGVAALARAGKRAFHNIL